MTTHSPLPQPERMEIQALVDALHSGKQKRRARKTAHVLVVEDDPLTRRMVSNCLKEDYALISVADGKTAVTEYLVHAPDIVFLDIGLPDIDGFNVLHQIITLDPDAFVVMFSGNFYSQNVERAMSGGAKGFVAKPFQKEMLDGYIRGSTLYHHKSQL